VLSRRTPRWILSVAAAALTLAAATACEIVPLDQEPGGSAGGAATAAEAKAQLENLRVAKAGSMRRYSRDKFPHWRSTGDNCDVRDTVLKRDGTKVKVSGCNVVAGTWRSVYDDRTLDSPTEVDIDHVVPLANAWRSGASAWTTDRRGDFANDIDRPQLVAVSQTSNRAKGDQDPSTWKPKATAVWCEYAADWIAVKSHWELSVTTQEKAALTDMLERC
jgi:hypothetical protein